LTQRRWERSARQLRLSTADVATAAVVHRMMYDDGDDENGELRLEDELNKDEDENRSKEDGLLDLAENLSEEALEKMKKLLEGGGIDIETRNNFGLTPLQVRTMSYSDFNKSIMSLIIKS